MIPSAHPVSPAPLEAADVKRVAALARLALSESEVAAAQRDLAVILSYVERLAVLDLSAVEPLTSPLEMKGRLAPDTPEESLSTDALMAMAPASIPPFVTVPKMLGGSGGSA
ncbi:MAG: Asp-tRNA(Asn)/Glu-tRNA(Gln) amidotransferase subunit GatC [Phycisphaerales bacterium]